MSSLDSGRVALMDALSVRLDQLAPAFTVPVTPRQPWLRVIGLFGSRAVEFRRAIELQLPTSPAAALVILRALVDLTILTLWVEHCPKLHLALWGAEGDREAVQHLDEMAALLAERQIPVPRADLPPETWKMRMRQSVERYRKIALVHGVPISKKPGDPLLPNVRDRARSLRLSELEVYDIAFGQVSAWTHSKARAFQFEIIEGGTGLRLIADPRTTPETIRRSAISFQAGTGAAVSRMLGLGLEQEYDFIRWSTTRQQDGEAGPMGTGSVGET
jgi:hypothetical protein